MSKKVSEWAKRLFRLKSNDQRISHTIIPRQKHGFSRKSVSPNALKVLYKLKDAGFEAYVVGGGVRDVLLGRHPKDFDIATNAHPEQVRAVFRNSRIIGRRFRLVHVYFGQENIEVSTFRANVIEQTKNEMIHRDNTFGTIEEDAWRRDFTVNALYYNIADFSLVDFCGGLHDLKNHTLRMIGDPAQRYHEDPVRLLRAIRLSSKLNLKIEDKTEAALIALPHLLQHVPTARLFDECLKLFFEGHATTVYQKMSSYGFLKTLFPQLSATESDAHYQKLIQFALKETDDRVSRNETTNPAFLFAIFLWPALQMHIQHFKGERKRFFMRLLQAIDSVLVKQLETVMISKRFQFIIQAIWILQFQLEKRRPNRIVSIAQHRYFRAALDFMKLRSQAGEPTGKLCQWWQTFQASNGDEQAAMIQALS